MKKILVLQSRINPDLVERERTWYERAVNGGAALDFISTLDTAHDWEHPENLLAGYDAVIIGGSSDFDYDGGHEESAAPRTGARSIFARVAALVRHVVNHEFPLLGVCLGHQIVAEVYGGGVTHDYAQKKIGAHEMQRSKDGACDPLLSGLPATFLAQYAHKDSVTSLPEGAVLLGSGTACKFSALRYGTKTYTFQFHPEVTVNEIRAVADYVARYLPPGVALESVLQESPYASRIIPLFMEKVVISSQS